MNDTPEQLGTSAANTAARAAITYLNEHNLEVESGALAACLNSWIKIKLPEALHDAKEAIDAHMYAAAETTFRATMALAGIEAAKEAGFPKAAFSPPIKHDSGFLGIDLERAISK